MAIFIDKFFFVSLRHPQVKIPYQVYGNKLPQQQSSEGAQNNVGVSFKI